MAGTSAESLIDVVDRRTGEPIGVEERSVAIEAGLPVRTVHLFLFDEQGRLLLQELGQQRDRHQLQWGSSVAAFPRPGEPADATARRRAAEEIGLHVPLRKVGTIETSDGDSPKFVTLFEGPAETPRILEPGHIESLRFWPLPEIDAELTTGPRIFTNTFRQVYGWWRERNRR